MSRERDAMVKSGIYSRGEINLEKIVKSLKQQENIPEAGAILTFSGIVRNSSEDGKRVIGMKIDAYEELANQSIQKICSELKEENDIIEVIIIHFKGEFKLSEDLVHVVVLSSHRDKGFEILRTAVERYKKEIAVWKRENYINGKTEWKH